MATVCLSKIGFIVAIAITAMLAFVVVVVAYSALLMLDRDHISASVSRLGASFSANFHFDTSSYSMKTINCVELTLNL